MTVNGNAQTLYVNTRQPTIGWTNLVDDINYAALGTINRTQDDLSQNTRGWLST